MSPTVFRCKSYRFSFFSREEGRMHIHVYAPDGEAKFWIEPKVALAKNHGLSMGQINEIIDLIKEHEDEIKRTWIKRQRH